MLVRWLQKPGFALEKLKGFVCLDVDKNLT